MMRVAVRRAQQGVPPEPVLRKIRIPFVQKARLLHEASVRAVFLVDLGLTGVFAELEAPLPVGEAVEISFPLPGNEISVSARCRVAWQHGVGDPPRVLPAGVGLEFVEISDADRERLREYIAEHLRRTAGSRRFTRPWPEAGGEE